ncbi:EthD family reductase [Pseudonocardia sp.]|uniref:EthD family reductase n=1 Tax=Pseudonocardia sp. TaxID=60912 RepID=UPI003D150AF5
MHQLIALYNHPEDAAAFDRHYLGTHGPLATKLPGLQRFTTMHPGPDPEGNPPAYYFIAVLDFADGAAVQSAVASPEGEAAIADLANFAQAGVTILTGAGEVVVSA